MAQRQTSIRQRQLGATLIEAMLASSIAGVLATSAAPAMSDLMSQQRLRSASSELFVAFHLARSEAIKRGTAVAVIPADTRDWSSGWKVFADENDNGALDAGEQVIAERQSMADSVTIRPYFGATYPGTVLTYSAQGRLHRPGGQGLVIGRLVLSHSGQSRAVCFASLGFRPVAAPTCD